MERERFVLEVIRGNNSVPQLSGEYGISRKTGYKWIKRHRALGLDGLRDRIVGVVDRCVGAREGGAKSHGCRGHAPQ